MKQSMTGRLSDDWSVGILTRDKHARLWSLMAQPGKR